MKGVPGLKWAGDKTYGPVVALAGWSPVVGRSDEVPTSPDNFNLTPGSTPDEAPVPEVAPEEVSGDDQ